MKKNISLLIIILVLVPLNFASGVKFDEIGIKLGVNFTNYFEISNYEDRKCIGKRNFTGGVFYSIQLEKNVFFQNEIYFNKKGSNIEYAGNTYNYDLYYIDTDHLIKIKLKRRRNIVPAILAGFFYSFNISSKGVSTIDGKRENIDLAGKINKAEYGGVLAFNLEYKMRKGSFLFDIRYVYGFSRVITDYIADVYNSGFYETLPGYKDINIKNKSINILIGYTFK